MSHPATFRAMARQPITMPRQHAVIELDHSHARILHFDAEHLQSHRVKAHQHSAAPHGHEARQSHQFFTQVCDATVGIDELLVVGSRQVLAEFGRYVREHHPATASRILGYDVVDHPTDRQLVSLARQFFLRQDHLADIGARTH